jgi:tripartite-type tricarboxylate transporter receptor subunit TctC
MSGKRAANFPDVPTVDEATGHKWHKGVWRAIVGPKGMANDIATQYETLLKKVYDSSEFQEFMTKRGFDVAWMGSTEFAAFLKKDDEEIGAILKSLGLAK